MTFDSGISVYADDGRFRDARKLLDGMPLRNLVSWNTVIAGYLRNDRIEEAYRLFEKMCSRRCHSWALIITCFMQSGQLESARKLFDLVRCSFMECHDSGLCREGQNRRS